MEQRIVLIDTETGGTSPGRHPLIQFAAIACTDDYEPIESIEVKLDFARALADPKALEMNSFSRESWDAALQPRTAVVTIAAFLKRHATLEQIAASSGRAYYVARVMAHRADFDMDFLRALFDDPGRQIGEPKPHGTRGEFLPAYPLPLCTLHLAQWTFRVLGEKPPRNWKLATIAEHFGLSTEGAHDAMADVRLAREIAMRCTTMLRRAA
jgi:DNA polymerase III epsilon subunit-like protein